MSKTKSKLSPKLKTKKPVSVFFKPVKADFKDLFKALAKGENLLLIPARS